MRYAIFPIAPRKNYGITIGSRVKPDSQIKEQIKGQIDRAMERFERGKDRQYKVAVIHETSQIESGSSDIPGFNGREQYLIFALLYSDPDPEKRNSNPSLSKGELEEYQREIEEMLTGILGDTKGALVLLQDCSVTVLESDPEGSWIGSVSPIVHDARDIFETPGRDL